MSTAAIQPEFHTSGIIRLTRAQLFGTMAGLMLSVLLASLEGISDVAVTGVEDPEWGQRVVALVVADGANHDDEIRAIASERLGPWAKPKEVRYVVAIPRTGNGKIRRSELASLH